jgi:hypothetical protein
VKRQITFAESGWDSCYLSCLVSADSGKFMDSAFFQDQKAVVSK